MPRHATTAGTTDGPVVVVLSAIARPGRRTGADVGVEGTALGPELTGSVVLAGGDELVVVRHDAGVLEVWRGDVDGLERTTSVDASGWPIAALVAVVHHDGTWHLFARATDGSTVHLIADDLADWHLHAEPARSFPAFSVTGATVRTGELLLAGRVTVDRAWYGWGLLCGDGRTFAPCSVPVPMASQLRLMGPVVTSVGDTALVLDSGAARTVARSTPLGWTLSLLEPELVPTHAFGDDGDVWVVGHLPDVSTAALARVADRRLLVLAPDGGPIRAAVRHGDHLVLARER